MTETAQSERELLLDIDEGVATITLNRPEALNALTVEMMIEMAQLFQQLDEDSAVRCIIVTGAGKAFSAGVDLKSLAAGSTMFQHDRGKAPGPNLMRVMADCDKPIIAAVNGFAVTGGFELALACDFIYASNRAKFADTHARVGLLPEWALSQKLPRLVGINRAREISFTGNYFSAEQGEAWGLVNRVLEPEELLPAALETARQIAETQPEALRGIKRLMNDGWNASLGEGLGMENTRSAPFNAAVDLSQMEERLAQLRARKK